MILYPPYLIPSTLFIVGACFGSFLNVIFYRYKLLKSKKININEFWFNSSRCPNCNNLIKKYYNIPILGWFLTKGKCSHCNSKISIKYPIVELIIALIFLGIYYLLIN